MENKAQAKLINEQLLLEMSQILWKSSTKKWAQKLLWWIWLVVAGPEKGCRCSLPPRPETSHHRWHWHCANKFSVDQLPMSNNCSESGSWTCFPLCLQQHQIFRPSKKNPKNLSSKYLSHPSSQLCLVPFATSKFNYILAKLNFSWCWTWIKFNWILLFG